MRRAPLKARSKGPHVGPFAVLPTLYSRQHALALYAPRYAPAPTLRGSMARQHAPRVCARIAPLLRARVRLAT